MNRFCLGCWFRCGIVCKRVFGVGRRRSRRRCWCGWLGRSSGLFRRRRRSRRSGFWRRGGSRSGIECKWVIRSLGLWNRRWFRCLRRRCLGFGVGWSKQFLFTVGATNELSQKIDPHTHLAAAEWTRKGQCWRWHRLRGTRQESWWRRLLAPAGATEAYRPMMYLNRSQFCFHYQTMRSISLNFAWPAQHERNRS